MSLQALDEEYLKVDAQFGGVDQRKIFTFAEKVRSGGFVSPLQPWLRARALADPLGEAYLGFWLAPVGSAQLLLLLSWSLRHNSAATHPQLWLSVLFEPTRPFWVPKLSGARSKRVGN